MIHLQIAFPVSGDGNGDDQNDGSADSLGADGNDGTDVDGVSEGATPSDEQQDEDTEGDSTKISDSNDDNDGQSIIKEQADESDNIRRQKHIDGNHNKTSQRRVICLLNAWSVILIRKPLIVCSLASVYHEVMWF